MIGKNIIAAGPTIPEFAKTVFGDKGFWLLRLFPGKPAASFAQLVLYLPWPSSHFYQPDALLRGGC